MSQEQTLVLLKPDALHRGLVGTIINRLERKGLKIIGMKMMQMSDNLVNEHYAHLAEKPFFPDLKKFIQSAPIIAMALEGLEAVAVVRQLVGATNGRVAVAGTIRGDYSMSQSHNVVHASDSPENGQIEVKRFFQPEELFEYERADAAWVYEIGREI